MKLTDLYRQRHKALERYVRRLLRNAEDAADVSQEAFLRAYAVGADPNLTHPADPILTRGWTPTA
jgi:DNA-directed RNA polymerase specialized sigma24 family protein